MSSHNPKDIVTKLFQVVDAFENQLKKEQEHMDNYALRDLQAINSNHDSLSTEYFSCLDIIETEDILLKLSKEEVREIQTKIANLTGLLKENREKLIKVEEQQNSSFRLIQESRKKNSAFYNRFGKQSPVSVTTWKESV